MESICLESEYLCSGWACRQASSDNKGRDSSKPRASRTPGLRDLCTEPAEQIAWARASAREPAFVFTAFSFPFYI